MAAAAPAWKRIVAAIVLVPVIIYLAFTVAALLGAGLVFQAVLIAALALGIDDAAIDALFVAASKL